MARVRHDLMHFTIHDLRRTARTHLAALGQRTALLIQAEEGTTQVTTIGALRSANSSANVACKAQ